MILGELIKILLACQSIFRIRTGPAMSHNYHKSGKCADHNGIQKNSQGGDHTLLTWVFCICCRR